MLEPVVWHLATGTASKNLFPKSWLNILPIKMKQQQEQLNYRKILERDFPMSENCASGSKKRFHCLTKRSAEAKTNTFSWRVFDGRSRTKRSHCSHWHLCHGFQLRGSTRLIPNILLNHLHAKHVKMPEMFKNARIPL